MGRVVKTSGRQRREGPGLKAGYNAWSGIILRFVYFE